LGLIRQNKGPVLFGMWWTEGGGHAMVGFRSLRNEIRFADQFGNAWRMEPAVNGFKMINEAPTFLNRQIKDPFLEFASNAIGMVHPMAITFEEAVLIPSTNLGALGQALSRGTSAVPSRENTTLPLGKMVGLPLYEIHPVLLGLFEIAIRLATKRARPARPSMANIPHGIILPNPEAHPQGGKIFRRR